MESTDWSLPAPFDVVAAAAVVADPGDVPTSATGKVDKQALQQLLHGGD